MSRTTKTIGLILFYAILLLGAKAVSMTLVSHVYLRASNAPSSMDLLQKVDELVQANQVLTYGVCSLLLALALHFLHPLSTTNWKHILPHGWITAKLRPSAARASVFAIAWIASAALSQNLSYLGVYINIDEILVSIMTTVAFVGAFFSMSIVEEFVLRKKIEVNVEHYYGKAVAILASSACLLVIKSIQFELTWLSILNVILLNVLLSQFSRSGPHTHLHTHDAVRSGNFLAVLLVFWHILFGLPLFDQDMPGIFLLRTNSETTVSEWISGGTQGPEGSLVLTVLIVVYLFFPHLKRRHE